ncbi:AMP-binding protein [Eubacteriales bacterium KG127]
MKVKEFDLASRFFEFDDLRELLKYSAKKYGDKTSFVTKIKTKGSKEVSYMETGYKDLYNEMIYLGTALREKGYIDRKVAVIGENSYHWCLAYFTAACGLGVTVPLDKALEKDEIISCLNRSEATVIFFDKKYEKLVQEIFQSGETKIELTIMMSPEGKSINIKESNSQVENKYLWINDLIEEGKAIYNKGVKSYEDDPIDREKMAFLLFTSGTTQQSKAVMLSHKNYMSCIYGMCCEELFYPDDVNMQILPLHHCYGMLGLLTFLTQGMKNTFCDGLKYISRNLKEYQVTVMMSVPLLLENLYKKINKAIVAQGMEKKINFALKLCNAGEKLGLNFRRRMFKPILDQLGGQLRFFINGAAALDPVVAKGLNDFGILTVNGYGLTETAPTIASESYRHIRTGSVGKLMPNVEGKIFQPGEDGIGELIVRGDNVMLGYYGDEDATKEVIVDEWFHTGDLAYFDEDGYLFITGRKKNVIVMKNGKNVFPEEIENLVNVLPYVNESMLFTRNKHNDVVLWLKVVYDKEYLREKKISLTQLEKIFERDLDEINRTMPVVKRVHKYFLSDKSTIKTTTQKTKRNLEIAQIDEELKERGINE